MAEASDNLVSLESFDGEIFEVEEAVASQTGFIKSVTGNVGTKGDPKTVHFHSADFGKGDPIP